jgi:uncharacterized protein YbgA (DUF1722 family)/uncharacterized protein YbbK (DUF523 family)
MLPRLTTKPRLGISACLLGQRVRYDGGHKRDLFLTQILAPVVEWVPVCPEIEVGMGVPRESVRLVGSPDQPRMLAERSGTDWTGAMDRFAERQVRELRRLRLAGYVLKKNSPSCGMERVKVYGSRGGAPRSGTGLFARALMNGLPLLPVEEEGRLNDAGLRENFIERVFVYQRWQELGAATKSLRALMQFHTVHKFQLLAHSETAYRALGRWVAGANAVPIGDAYERYGRDMMRALALPATTRKHANALEHMTGYFSRDLSPAERQELVEIIADYRRGLVPLIVPITLIRHHVRRLGVPYLHDQSYLEPSPKELMLRNHV